MPPRQLWPQAPQLFPSLKRFAHAFVRWSKGLAAYDELAQPTSFGTDLKTTNANELSFGGRVEILVSGQPGR